MTGLGETETKILKKLRNPVPFYMSWKDSDKKVNNKTTNVLKDMNGMKSSKRMVDFSECKPIGSMSLLKFVAGTIPPDVDGKIKSESKRIMKMKDVIVPWEIKANKKFGNAIELDLLDAFNCESSSEREL